MSLYLKYRPRNIDELDLASVRKTLTDIVKANKIAHAYLLTGPRGAGKTSTARILARIVNCEKNDKTLGEPCNECAACRSILSGSAVDVVEIDAASNRGIDDIRELKEKIRLAPAILRKKVYIIDEVHMLTTEAFNALLKTLEEPPEHSLFILCTTEAHKVPETISSRCTRIAFTKATPEEMQRSFARVVAGEGVAAAQEALELLSASVDGSFRDGVKVLDQVIMPGMAVTVAAIQEVLSGVAGYSVQPFASSMIDCDLGQALNRFHEAANSGVDFTYLLTATMSVVRVQMITTGDKRLAALIFLLDDTARRLALSQVPTVLVEAAIVSWCGEDGSARRHVGKSEKSADQQVSKPASQHASESASQKAQHIGKSMDQSADKSEKAEFGTADKQTSRQTDQTDQLTSRSTGVQVEADAAEVWRKLLGNLNGDSVSLGALLAKASPSTIAGDTLTIRVQYDFHRQQLMTEKIRSRLEALVSTAVGQPMKVMCEIGEIAGKPTPADMPASELQGGEVDDTIAAAEEIFSAKG